MVVGGGGEGGHLTFNLIQTIKPNHQLKHTYKYIDIEILKKKL